MKSKLLFVTCVLLLGLIPLSYSDTEQILLYMCLEKQKHDLQKNCNNISHNLNDSHVVKSSNIGIILSNSCLAMINNNITNSCPNYDFLQKIYPGVIVNPENDVISKIRLITISPSLPEFKINQNSTKTTLNHDTFEIIFGVSQYVDGSCENAMVNTELFLLGSIIWYMADNCEEDNSLLFATHSITQNAIPFSHNSSNAWNELNHWENMEKNCYTKYHLC